MVISSKLKLILLISLAVLSLSLFVFIYFYQESVLNPVSESETPPKIQTAPLTPEEEIEFQKKAAEIIKTNDFNKCQEIENEIYRTVCINNIALNLAKERQDISYCQKLDNELVSITNCERQVIFEKSQNKEDINVCDETENREIQKECRENFWLLLALKKGDISLCDNTPTEQEKNSCYDNYLFRQEFIRKESSFECQRFYSRETKLDCQIYQEMILNKGPVVCDSLKSNLFLNYCVLLNIR